MHVSSAGVVCVSNKNNICGADTQCVAMHAAHETGATIELAEPQVDTLIKEAMDSAEKLRQSGDNLQQRAQTAATAMRGQLAEFASALRAESGMSFRGGDFREMAQLANINRRRTARAAISVRFSARYYAITQWQTTITG